MEKAIILTPIILLILSSLPPSIASQNVVSTVSGTVQLYEEVYKYYNYQNMTNLLYELQENHTNIMSITSLGKTYQGRDIWVVKLSDNVSKDENEPDVLLMGAHHGNEKPSYEVLIYFIKHMVENYGKENTDDDLDGFVNEDPIDGFDNDDDGFIDEDPSEDRVREAINNTQIYLIPMVNPDGVEANTRKNCAPNYGIFGFRRKITSYGVDLNRNYGYRWYLKFLLPRFYRIRNILMFMLDSAYGYGGEKPFSENETRAVKQFVETHNISISISYHSYGEWMFIPWCYTSKPTKDEQVFVSIGENMSYINKYDLVPVNESRFPIFPRSIGLAMDWLYGEHNILAFLIELGTSLAPTNTSLVMNLCRTHIGVNLYVCERSLLLKKKSL